MPRLHGSCWLTRDSDACRLGFIFSPSRLVFLERARVRAAGPGRRAAGGRRGQGAEQAEQALR